MDGWISVIIAGIALFVSIGSAFYSWKQQSAAFRLAWYQEVVEWAKQCTRAFSIAHELMSQHDRSSAEYRSKSFETLCALTSLIDEGRFVFENNRRTDWGKDKPRAYQGYRPDALDWLVEAYDILRKAGSSEAAISMADQERIVSLKRKFVSDIQSTIEPNWFWKAATITPKAKVS